MSYVENPKLFSDLRITHLNEFSDFDPACWEYEGAQAKIVVYYPRNELKILWKLPFTFIKAPCCSNEHKQYRGFLAPNSFGRFFTLNFCLILSRLHCIFCEDILSYLNITNLPMYFYILVYNSIYSYKSIKKYIYVYVTCDMHCPRSLYSYVCRA